MFNGIIKLFYTEVVKKKIKELPSEGYQINEEAKKLQVITSKIDFVAFFMMKFFILSLIFLFTYKFNAYLGFFVLILEIVYIFFKDSIKLKVTSNLEGVVQAVNKSEIIDKEIIRNISILISILFLGFIMEFNWSVILSFIVVLGFTIVRFIGLLRK